MAPRSASLPDLTKQIAEQMAILKDGHDYKPKITDYGFAKAQVPKFEGDVREYIKWRRQVEDYLNSYPAATSQKQTVQHLDTLTPKEIDVSRCLNLEAVWGKLTGEFGSPTYISRVLIKDFTNFVPNKFNDETKLIQLRNTMAKLESDLITNDQANRCNDFLVLDHAETLIPGRFREAYIEVKDKLVDEKGTPWAALIHFLDEKATRIQKHMPDLLEDRVKESPAS